MTTREASLMSLAGVGRRGGGCVCCWGAGLEVFGCLFLLWVMLRSFSHRRMSLQRLAHMSLATCWSFSPTDRAVLSAMLWKDALTDAGMVWDGGG